MCGCAAELHGGWVKNQERVHFFVAGTYVNFVPELYRRKLAYVVNIERGYDLKVKRLSNKDLTI